jgi:hypothetical protein
MAPTTRRISETAVTASRDRGLASPTDPGQAPAAGVATARAGALALSRHASEWRSRFSGRRDTRGSIYWGGPPGPPTFGNLVIVLFLLAQAADGVFTYVGLRLHGPLIEGNPLLSWLMQVMGSGTALASAKACAAGLGIVLHLTAVHRIVAALTAVYLFAALLPWAFVLIHGV